MQLQLSGRFSITAIRPDGSVRTVADWFPNMILDAGLNRIGQGGFLSHCMVGSSSTAPLAGQSALVTQVASTDTVLSTSTGTDLGAGYAYLRRTFRFAAGTAAGNLSEVGVGWSGSACFSRALIVDGSGTPTAITVLTDEILDVTYEFRRYWPTSDATATLAIGGTNYTVVSRASDVGSWEGSMAAFVGNGSNDINNQQFDVTSYTGGTAASLGAITTSPGMTADASVPMGFGAAYVGNSYERQYGALFPPLVTLVPITALRFKGVCGIFKCSFTPAVPKDNTKNFSQVFKYTWARKVL